MGLFSFTTNQIVMQVSKQNCHHAEQMHHTVFAFKLTELLAPYGTSLTAVCTRYLINHPLRPVSAVDGLMFGCSDMR